MLDFNTAVQTALSPVVTLPVIAVLAIGVAVQTRRIKTRLREQSIRLGKMTGVLLAAATAALKSETEREVARAIEFTYDTLKGIGFDKLASGEITFEGVMFGGRMPKAESLRRRPLRDNPFDEPFSLDELREALGGKPRYSGSKPGQKNAGDEAFAHVVDELRTFAAEPKMDGGTVLRPGEGPNGEYSATRAKDEGAGLGDRGPRPYHKATDFDDLSGRSPRAG
jgi:hypothetical protein